MSSPRFVWMNDALVPVDQARVSVQDRGFLYGDGFFETLRAENGRTFFLAEHLARLGASAQAFRIPFPDDIPWQERIAQLLRANGLEKGSAAVKILLTRGEAEGLGLPLASSPTLIISARSYTPPSPEEYAHGWPVVVFPEPRTTFLGRHKSLNYLFYLAARQYALDQGAREALILEADGSLSEGAATSLLLRHQGRFVTPAAPSALPGVTLAVLARNMQRFQRPLEWMTLSLSHLKQAEGLWLVNSLMGIMPVAALEGQRLAPHPELTAWLQECLAQASS